MKLLADDIYGKISAIVPNTYFSQLPANIDSSQNFCVYELEVDESKNTLHERDFEQGVEIIVKVLSKDIGYLFDTVESIRQAVLQHTANYYSPIVKNTIPVFYDENLKLHQYSIVFGVNRGSIPFTGTLVNKYAPDATAIVQDQDGNVLATENIPSGGSKEIIVNVQGMINVLKGDFNGEFELSVQDQNGFYNDYESSTVINTLSIAANPTLGALATVRIIGGSLASDAIPTNWAFSGDTISQDIAFYNEIMILYVSSTDIRIVNRLVDAPDVTAPIFSVAPTATNIAETSFDITATLDENGTVYGYLLADGSPAPTVQEIIDNAQSQFTDSGSGGALSFTGLVTETNYDVYVVAEDTEGNRQANSTLLEVLTTPELSIIVDWEQEVRATDLGSGTIKISELTSFFFYENGAYATNAINGNNTIFFKGDTQISRGAQGLGITNTYEGIVGSAFTMDIWVQLRETGGVRVFENGVVVQDTQTWITTDEISITYTSGTVTVEKNGVLFYTSGLSYTLPLTPIALLSKANIESKIIDARFDNNTNLIVSPL